MKNEISPTAQAVLDAVEDDRIHPTDLHRIAAAALLAAADQVIEEVCPVEAIITIAAELEGAND